MLCNCLRLSVFAALTALLLLVAGCGNNAPGGDTAKGRAPGEERVKIAFIVKQPEEPWFQLEWKFADQAAQDLGFELIKIAATDGDQVLSKIDNAAAQGAQGLIICSPDVKLGPAIVARCQQRGLKLMTVDDQLVGPDGQFLDVPHVGISARQIGNAVGKAAVDEAQRRGWDFSETRMLVVTYEQLDTARERTEGQIEAAVAAGFPRENVVKAPEKTTDIPGSREAATPVLTQNPRVKNWIITSMNDTGAMGAVRATEAFNISADRVVGIGINGDSALEDFKKREPTGLYASMLLQARRHGYDTCKAMFEWITQGTEPAKITYTDGILITRENFRQVLEEQGISH
jgi:L-arabinose transport system substrate-binding protein